MDYSISTLVSNSSEAWLNTVLNDFDSFLQDHADCERKASSMAMSFVAKFPDRLEIIPELIDTAVEELQHFRQVYRLMEQRGITLTHEIKPDLYIKNLVNLCRSGREDRFLDRLVLASVVEWRGCERFRMIAESIEESSLQKFYENLWQSEARHGESFVRMGLQYFPEEEVQKRVAFFVEKEAIILENLELRSALH